MRLHPFQRDHAGHGAAAMQVPYCIQLQKGSFETPDIAGLKAYHNKNNNTPASRLYYSPDGGTGTFFTQYPSGEGGIVWQTTGVARHWQTGSAGLYIELADGSNRSYNGTRNYPEASYSIDSAYDGQQFAELNCEAYGALYQDEVDALKIQGVPSVFADGKLLHVGRGEFGELLAKLEAQYGIDETKVETEVKEYDVIVAGGGPAGVSAAIYSARKGLRVAIVAERVGGQVKETVGIENLISVPETTGNELADNLKTHLLRYPVDLLEHRKVEKVEVVGKQKQITTSVGEKFLAPALIIATGASWRKLNVPGEAEYIGRGVAFCPHCDGPFYKGKHVAVVGGGNSGIEAAIDLAGICSKVTVFEFMDELKADSVLQDRLKSLPNVEVFVSSQTTEVIGNGDKLTALRIKDRKTEEERLVELDGVFVQIGLSANSSVFRDIVETNRPGEIMIDAHCRTNVTGIYAAGDVSTVPYKQIIISMGEGAKAALSAFDDRVRGII